MHVDSVEIKFSNDCIVAARAGIDIEYLELQRPVGLCFVVIAEGVHVEALLTSAVLTFPTPPLP